MKKYLKEAVYGLAIGDAVGVPFEFKARDSFTCEGMTGYGTHGQAPGTWSDDTSMTLATCKSLQEKEKVDLDDLWDKFYHFLRHAKFTADHEVFDVGNTTMCTIPNRKGATGEHSNGNGSLMRILPLAFVEDITDEQIRNVSAITHAHPISKDACVYYVHAANKLLELAGSSRKPAEKMQELVNCLYADIPAESVFARVPLIAGRDRMEIKSSGYVVDTFEAAIWALLTTRNYRDCILKAVNLGSDTDTVAAVAGGLAGLIYGFEGEDGIPAEWVETLRAKKLIDSCLF
ncbi:MAG: ADP-ribosylglycohydrolase family protein [Eubacterium sp.]|nr:ADP-ribosylglycohydrolase family protein [Eubacterium sp.]